MPIIRTTSQLLEADKFKNGDLLEISQRTEDASDPNVKKYISKKIDASNFTNSMFEHVCSKFKADYGLPEPSEKEPGQQYADFKFTTMYNQLKALYSGNNFNNTASKYTMYGAHRFVDPPDIDTIRTDFSNIKLIENETVNVGSLAHYADSHSPMFIGTDSNYKTKYRDLEDNVTKEDSGIENAFSVDSERCNIYIFRVKNKVSNKWTAPVSGVFTCYGWLDQKNATADGINANYNCWVVLEALLKDSKGSERWVILQLQPFNKNAFCSYVGFCVGVAEGTVLRIRTGFVVGTNSGKYQTFQGSISNHIANAFVGGIFCGINYTPVPSNGGSAPGGGNGGSHTTVFTEDKLDAAASLGQTKDKVNKIIDYLNDDM